MFDVNKETGSAAGSGCVVVALRRELIRPWLRAYFSSNNNYPLVIIPLSFGEWSSEDRRYCVAAAEQSNGILLDATEVSRGDHIVMEEVLRVVTRKISPRAWAWISDRSEVVGDLGECFDCAERMPGFVCARFLHPDATDARHPDSLYGRAESDGRLFDDALVFFHGGLNDAIMSLDTTKASKALGPMLDSLYRTDPAWHDGFCDFSLRGWQKDQESGQEFSDVWGEKIFYYSSPNEEDVLEVWSSRAKLLPKAPFERDLNEPTPSKYAFAVCASGDRHVRYRDNLVRGLRRFVPGVDIVDVDMVSAEAQLPNIPSSKTWNKSIFARLAIPLMDEFRKYDRVVWLDVDTDVTSEEFARILTVETSSDGLAAAPDVNQLKYASYMSRMFPAWKGPVYFNSGVLVMDICKIKPEEWRQRIQIGMESHAKKKFRWPDQDMLNAFFSIKEMDSRLNRLWLDRDASRGAYLTHYANNKGKRRLDALISDWEAMGVDRSRCAFAICAEGDRFAKYRINAIGGLRRFVPGVDIVDIDLAKTGDVLDSIPDDQKATFARFAIPLMDDFSKYDRVVWLDVDIDVVSESFRNIMGVQVSEDGLAAVADRWQGMCVKGLKSALPQWNNPVYFNAGILVMDLAKIDKVSWRKRVLEALKSHAEHNFERKDQDVLNAYFDIHEMDARFNGMLSKGEFPEDAFLYHYLGRKGKTMLDAVVARNEPYFEDPVDAVFVIGTGSLNNNEELRYALRNLEANCKFIRDVYICGYCPPWVDKTRVRHLQWPDRFTHAKDANIIDKLRHACEHPGIAKRILFCSDDQFQTRECVWDDFSPRHLRKYKSDDDWYENRHRIWHTRLRSTLERDKQRRIANGLDPSEVYYYQPHIWMPIDRDQFIAYAKWSDYEKRDDTIIASGYFNFIGAKGKPDFDHVFIGNSMKDVPKTTHVAYHDGSYDSAMNILRKLFPSKSRFELGAAGDNKPAATGPTFAVNSRVLSKPSDDQSLTSPDEISRILSVMDAIRKNVVWHNLLGDVSRAEEMRLFCARGWRTVWSDIIRRWSDATCNGIDLVPVSEPRSDKAKEAINAYLNNPNAVRGAAFGPQPPPAVRQLPRPPNVTVPSGAEIRNSLRGKLGESLRLRGK